MSDREVGTCRRDHVWIVTPESQWRNLTHVDSLIQSPWHQKFVTRRVSTLLWPHCLLKFQDSPAPLCVWSIFNIYFCRLWNIRNRQRSKFSQSLLAIGINKMDLINRNLLLEENLLWERFCLPPWYFRKPLSLPCVHVWDWIGTSSALYCVWGLFPFSSSAYYPTTRSNCGLRTYGRLTLSDRNPPSAWHYADRLRKLSNSLPVHLRAFISFMKFTNFEQELNARCSSQPFLYYEAVCDGMLLRTSYEVVITEGFRRAEDMGQW